jgi:hypothetical protein
MLHDAPIPADANRFARFNFPEKAAHLWAIYRARVLADWIEQHPGTRPSCWWKFDRPENDRPKFHPWPGEPRSLPAPNVQRAYLARHCLLEPGESEFIEATDPQPSA